MLLKQTIFQALQIYFISHMNKIRVELFKTLDFGDSDLWVDHLYHVYIEVRNKIEPDVIYCENFYLACYGPMDNELRLQMKSRLFEYEDSVRQGLIELNGKNMKERLVYNIVSFTSL